MCNQAKHRFPGLYDVQRHNLTCIKINSLYTMPDLHGAAPSSCYTWLLTHFCVQVWGYSPPCTKQNIWPTWHWPLRALSVNELWFTVRTFPEHLTIFNRSACSFWTQTSWHNPLTYDSTWTNTPTHQGPTKQIPAHPNSHDPQIFPLAILTIIFPMANFNAILASSQSAMSLLSTQFFPNLEAWKITW